jgi:hypothetical protein
MDIVYIFVSAGMEFRNKKMFRYHIPAHTSSFRALVITLCGLVGRYQRFRRTYCLHLQS